MELLALLIDPFKYLANFTNLDSFDLDDRNLVVGKYPRELLKIVLNRVVKTGNRSNFFVKGKRPFGNIT